MATNRTLAPGSSTNALLEAITKKCLQATPQQQRIVYDQLNELLTEVICFRFNMPAPIYPKGLYQRQRTWTYHE